MGSPTAVPTRVVVREERGAQDVPTSGKKTSKSVGPTDDVPVLTSQQGAGGTDAADDDGNGGAVGQGASASEVKMWNLAFMITNLAENRTSNRSSLSPIIGRVWYRW